MMSPVGQGGGEINFIPDAIAGQIGKQESGVLGNMTLPDSNQLNSPIIQCKPILKTGLQQTFEKVNNASYF